MNIKKIIKAAAVATIAIMSATSTASADYTFEAKDASGKVATVAINCSNNWAKTNGAARRWEKKHKGGYTRLVKTEKGSCQATAAIPSKR